MSSKIVVPLARGLEEIEAITIVDTLRRAGNDVTTAGLGNTRIEGSHQIKLQADQRLKNINARVFDGIALPGGMPGTENLKHESRVIQLVREFDATERLVAAICAAPLVLLDAGILEGRAVTSYPSFADRFSGLDYRQQRVVKDDHIITSRGPGTALDFALEIVGYLNGPEKRAELAENMIHI